MKELKSMKRYAKVVFIDSNEKKSAPEDVKAALNKAGKTLPLLVFLSPDSQTTYAEFGHAALKSQNFSKIFRDLKKKIRDAQKDGSLNSSGVVAKDDTKDEGSNNSSDLSSVTIKNARFQNWKSAKGSAIYAKLIKFENDTYHFLTTSSKTIKVKASGLDPASLKVAEELVNLNKK